MSLLVFLLVLASVFIFDTQLDKIFFSDLTNGLIPEMLATLLTILILDQLIHYRSVSLAKDLNQSHSDKVHFLINLFIHRLMQITENATADEIREEGIEIDSNFEFAMRRFKQEEGGRFIERFLDKIYQEDLVQAKNFIEKVQQLIETNAKEIVKSLNQIHPNPNPEILSFFIKDIYFFVGVFNAAIELFSVGQDDNVITLYANEHDLTQQKAKDDFLQMRESLHHLLPVFGPGKIELKQFIAKISHFSEMAKNNELEYL